jgi:hypothetical protein
MPGRGPQTFKKRQKEQQRKEKQQEKMAKRLVRKDESASLATTDQEEHCGIRMAGFTDGSARNHETSANGRECSAYNSCPHHTH